jgi:hypothetical protein
MGILLDVIAVALIALGLAGAIIPTVPGIPMIFIGIWLLAGVDHYHHVGYGWLICIAAVGAVGLTIDLLAGALGVKRVGASKQAVLGALCGTVERRRQRVAWFDFRHDCQTGLVRDDGGDIGCRLVVEPDSVRRAVAVRTGAARSPSIRRSMSRRALASHASSEFP